MKILFLCRHHTYYRNFESVLRELARRGHELHLVIEREDKFGGTRLIETLTAEFPNITSGVAVSRPKDQWRWTARRLRLGLDYLRYQHPVFDTAHKLRSRARVLTPGAFVALGDAVHAAGDWSRRLASGLLYRLECAVPEEPAIREFIQAHRPDVMLVSPLIDLGSSQIDYIRAARGLRIPTALCVWSWDNLSSKALIREWPDRVFVWNETQRAEAVELHGLPGARVVVTGAQCFDQWFNREPSRDRAEFCRQVGLPADRPFILYVCSALFRGSPVEANFVLDWIRHIRSSPSPVLREAGILVRPHPGRMAEWKGIDTTSMGAVVWGSNPVHKQAKEDYFDSLYHSAAVVGINTSAFIEAGIAGRSVHTLIVPQYEENQTATVHFEYLLKVGGGLLKVARSFEEHGRQLDDVLRNPPSGPSAFVREFVRPHGLDRAATPIFVENVEAMKGLAVEGPPSDPFVPVWRGVVNHIARMRDNEGLKKWTLSERERESVSNLIEFHRKKQERHAARLAMAMREKEERLQRYHTKEERKRRLQAEKEADKQRRFTEKNARLLEKRRAKRRAQETEAVADTDTVGRH